MKIRQWFVSNSSSSSFIIQLPTIPKTEDELKKYLDFKYLKKCLKKYYNKIPSKSDIISSLFSAIQCSNRYNFTEEEFKKLNFSDCNDIMYDLEIKITDLKFKSLFQIVNEYNNLNRIIFSYSDENGEFDSMMEHMICPYIFGKYLISYSNNH